MGSDYSGRSGLYFVVTMGDSEKASRKARWNRKIRHGWLSAVKTTDLLCFELFHYKPNAKWGDTMNILQKFSIEINLNKNTKSYNTTVIARWFTAA